MVGAWGSVVWKGKGLSSGLFGLNCPSSAAGCPRRKPCSWWNGDGHKELGESSLSFSSYFKCHFFEGSAFF